MFINAWRTRASSSGMGVSGIDAAHSSDVEEITDARPQIPRTGWPNCPCGRQCLDTTWRNLLRGNENSDLHDASEAPAVPMGRGRRELTTRGPLVPRHNDFDRLKLTSRSRVERGPHADSRSQSLCADVLGAAVRQGGRRTVSASRIIFPLLELVTLNACAVDLHNAGACDSGRSR
jgi:hypothetical protein